MKMIQAMEVRKSVRKYSAERVEEPVLLELTRHLKEAEAMEGFHIRFQVMETTDSSWQAKTGFLYGIGKIKAPAMFVCMYETEQDLLECARIMEQEVLYLTAKGLGTCILGTYDIKYLREACEMKPQEKVAAVVVFGTSAGNSFLNDGFRTLAGSRKRKDVSEILLNYEEWKDEGEMLDIVKHAILAPSGNNVQPVRVRLSKGKAEFYVQNQKIIDAGIFMEHFYLAARVKFEEVTWKNMVGEAEENGLRKAGEICY